jgi:hypothetical protein
MFFVGVFIYVKCIILIIQYLCDDKREITNINLPLIYIGRLSGKEDSFLARAQRNGRCTSASLIPDDKLDS